MSSLGSSSRRGQRPAAGAAAAGAAGRLHLADVAPPEEAIDPGPCPRARLRAPEAPGLPRKRLMERLDRILVSRVAMLVAPAGYGKTTVMAQWARRAAVDIAWYRLDSGDSQGAVLVRHLAAAVEEGTGVPVPATDLASLIHAVESREAPMVLVVDDLHLGGPAAERLLYELLLAAPPHLYVLVGSRRMPAYNLARSELVGFVVGGEELRFSGEEIELLFREVYGAPLEADDAALLARRTGGWAAALQIFHLSTTDASASGRRRAIRTPDGPARYARDYLCWEVLDGLPPELADFVRRTCVFEVVTAGRCDELLGRRGSQRLLEDLGRWQALTWSPDGGLTFRYHEMLRAHLQNELREELGQEGLVELSRRAAAILEGEGALVEALRVRSQVGDWADVGRLVRAHAPEIAVTARSGWVSGVPDSLRDSEPGLALAHARMAVDDGRLAEAAAVAAQVAASAATTEITDEAARLAATLAHWTYDGDTIPPSEDADWTGLLREALRRRPAEVAARAASLDDPWAPLVEGLCLLLAGDVVRAVPVLREAATRTDCTPRLGHAARLAAALLLADGGAEARRVATDATADELPWLARMARALAGAQELVATGTTAVATVQARCESRGDAWGATLAAAMRCAAEVGVGRVDLASLEDLVRRLRALDAPVLEAWARGGLALAAARDGAPDAEREAASAEAFARTAGVPGALALAYAAMATCDQERRAELMLLADACADEAGLSIRPWAHDERPLLPPQRGRPEVHVADGAEMTIRCFGRFDIRLDGHVPDLTRVRPRARALLRLLAVEAGGPVHRELIIDALWRDLDREAGTHNLHVSVSSLRRALEPGVPRGASRLLVRDGERYLLALPPGSTCDLRSFDQALAGADVARAAGRVEEAIACLTDALELYAGEVLPEDGPEEWVLGPREHYRARAAEAAASAADLHLSRHDHAAAAAAALHSIDIDPCRDASWRLLVAAYQSGGDLAAAERARRSYADVLASLGVVTDRASAVLPRQAR